MTPALTHIALGVENIEATVAFYRDFTGLQLVHDRTDDGTRVVWLGEDPSDPSFVLVLIEGAAPRNAGPATLLHFGFSMSSRDEVDAIAERGRAAGLLAAEPIWAGSVVGYFCMLKDPDGHWVEFSHGQSLGPHEE